MEDHSQIARLETELQTLADAELRCRKLDVGAKLAMAAGALWLGAAMLGLARGEAGTSLVAIAALIGGIVLYGSNQSSWAGLRQRREAAEAQRAALIDALDMRLVREPGEIRRLH